MCNNCEIVYKKLKKIFKDENKNEIKSLKFELNEEKKKNFINNLLINEEKNEKKEKIEDENENFFLNQIKLQIKNYKRNSNGHRFIQDSTFKNYFLTLNYFISKKAFDLLRGKEESPNFLLPSQNSISRYKPSPTYDILDEENIKSFIEERSSKSYYVLALDDIEVATKYEKNKNTIYGGIKNYSIDEFIKEDINILRENFAYLMNQIYLICIFTGESIPICCFLRKFEKNYVDIIEKKIKEIIIKIKKIDKENFINIIGGVSDGEFCREKTRNKLEEWNLKEYKLPFLWMHDTSHAYKCNRNVLLNRNLIYNNINNEFSISNISSSMLENEILFNLLSDDAICITDIMNESFALELSEDKVIQELKKNKKNEELVQYLYHIRLLYDTLHCLSFSENKEEKIISEEEKIKNLEKIKNYFLKWKENKNVDKINKPSIITLDNNINNINNWLNLIKFVEKKKIEEKLLIEKTNKEKEKSLIETIKPKKKKRKINTEKKKNFILNLSILFCSISTLVVEHQFSVIRFKCPIPTALFYFMWIFYSYVIMSIINLPESVRGFSINNIHKFRNRYYGKITTTKVPKFVPRKEIISEKLDEETKKKLNKKLEEVNSNSSILTVRGKTTRKKAYICQIEGCQKKKGFFLI
jgi:hypothetical protein